MPTIPTGITAGARGITHTLDDYVVLSYGIDKAPVYQQYPDQVGAIAHEQAYDHRYDLQMQCYSKTTTRTAPATAGDQITFADATWAVDKVAEAGSYNDTLKWSVTAHRYDNFPLQP